MNITTFYLSYLFLGVSIISIIFFIYFRLLIVKTESNSEEREKIIGTMKDSDTWRRRNNMMSYICAFWAVLSLVIFIYLKFFYTSGPINIIYFYIYAAVALLSILLLVLTKKEKGV